jgi:hypothetical protein
VVRKLETRQELSGHLPGKLRDGAGRAM